ISSGDTLYSPCPGRVASESTIDTKIRNLSIAYQSIVITFIFLLALSFFLSASMLVKNVSRAHKSVKRAISILKELFKSTITIVLGFLLRCILFLIILAADFESSIYMFITLVITEIIVILLISILWWRMAVMKHRQSLSSSSPDTSRISKATGGTSSS
ncbi:MAG: hypothetical protein Q8P67_27320, partial [archaeon]|nr:hypothetical protein [archaeon]